ncbi:MAG TPA: YlxR family protein [Actinomycetes bacterium]|nr:YlxR family protein [Actinomycetes bacterium]
MGCRQKAPQADLLRVVAVPGPAGMLAVPDPRRQQPGRGAYVHLRPECLDLAERRRAFPRALRLTGALDHSQVGEQISQSSPSQIMNRGQDEMAKKPR